MTQQNSVVDRTGQSSSLKKRMFIGAGIALVLIIVFLSGVNHPNPQWGRLWMIKPLLVVTLAGAMGGLYTYYLQTLLGANGQRRIIIALLSILGFIVAIWLGSVLGLNGTLWN
jgi:ABC-type transport system involved in cytochrome c biogenesis permease subunit